VGAIETVSTLGLQAMLRGDAGVRDVYERAAHPHIVGHALAAAGVGALPLVDLVGVPAVQAKLLHSLATAVRPELGRTGGFRVSRPARRRHRSRLCGAHGRSGTDQVRALVGTDGRRDVGRDHQRRDHLRARQSRWLLFNAAPGLC
jgi:hypothetical protein